MIKRKVQLLLLTRQQGVSPLRRLTDEPMRSSVGEQARLTNLMDGQIR